MGSRSCVLDNVRQHGDPELLAVVDRPRATDWNVFGQSGGAARAIEAREGRKRVPRRLRRLRSRRCRSGMLLRSSWASGIGIGELNLYRPWGARRGTSVEEPGLTTSSASALLSSRSRRTLSSKSMTIYPRAHSTLAKSSCSSAAETSTTWSDSSKRSHLKVVASKVVSEFAVKIVQNQALRPHQTLPVFWLTTRWTSRDCSALISLRALRIEEWSREER